MLSLNSFLEIIFLNDNFSIYIRLLIISLLIICSALISGSEIAFFSLSNKQIDDSSKSKDRILKIKNEDKYDDVKGDSETLAGFLLEQIGFFPKSNFVYVFDKIEFVIKSVDKKRIKLIKVKLIK